MKYISLPLILFLLAGLSACSEKTNTQIESGDFSISFKIKTGSDLPMVLLSKKDFPDKSIRSQKNPGWVLYTSGGALAWNVGSGNRRLNYERDNGNVMPINDGKWHLVRMTYSKALSEFRLFMDERNIAVYKVEFDFSNDLPVTKGLTGSNSYSESYHEDIISGSSKLQEMVDAFNALTEEKLKDSELIGLLVDPDPLLHERDLIVQGEKTEDAGLTKFRDIRKSLAGNPYTVFQNMNLTLLKPVSKLYYLDNGEININPDVAEKLTKEIKLGPPDFRMKSLQITQDVSYPAELPAENKISELNIGVWNIWHGGIHWNEEEDGWDSRKRIVEMIKENDIDIILFQETYSSGDFIAAELGYYFATTSDWDYCFQGSNISVLSKYPIIEVFVPFEASFNNVGAKIRISKTQEVYAMSNWYGMNSFPVVYDFHESRFGESDDIPVFFGGDFNAVPHTDGGNSPASVKMLDNGFTDAYRSIYIDPDQDPGHTHRSGSRIDQLYYKGEGLKNISTRVISDKEGGFPSDHYLILSRFKLAEKQIHGNKGNN